MFKANKHSGVFIVIFEKKIGQCSGMFLVYFEYVFFYWVLALLKVCWSPEIIFRSFAEI